MRRSAFTFVELCIALTISAFLLAAFGGLLTSIWIMTKVSTDELQCIVRADFLRQKFFYRLTDDRGELWSLKDKEGNVLKDKDGKVRCVGGLPSATEILCCAEGAKTQIVANFQSDEDTTADSWVVDLAQTDGEGKRKIEFFGLDASKCRAADYRQPTVKDGTSVPPSVQYIYLAIPCSGKTVYYDRLIIPSFSGFTEDMGLAEFAELFGGK